MTVLVAPDSFGDTLTAVAAADCIAEGWLAARSQDTVLLAPQSDGGPGFVDVLASRLGAVHTTRVPGPLGADVDARWLLHDDPDGAASGLTTAYLECAQCCGLHQLGGTPPRTPRSPPTPPDSVNWSWPPSPPVRAASSSVWAVAPPATAAPA